MRKKFYLFVFVIVRFLDVDDGFFVVKNVGNLIEVVVGWFDVLYRFFCFYIIYGLVSFYIICYVC